MFLRYMLGIHLSLLATDILHCCALKTAPEREAVQKPMPKGDFVVSSQAENQAYREQMA